MWEDGVSLGPTSHSVLDVPQKHNDTLTNMGLSALRPKQNSSATLVILLLLVWQSVWNPEGRGPTYLLVHIYTELIHLPCSSLKRQTKSAPFSSPNQKLFTATDLPYMLGTTWHVLVIILGKICCFRWTVSLSISLCENDCITRTSEKDFKASFFFSFFLKLATQILWKALPKTSFVEGEFLHDSDRIQKRN